MNLGHLSSKDIADVKMKTNTKMTLYTIGLKSNRPRNTPISHMIKEPVANANVANNEITRIVKMKISIKLSIAFM